MSALKAPFPWFGGKSRAAAEVSAALGDVHTYCEPFAGSLGVLLQRAPVSHEVVNDLDGFIANFWRAVKTRPDELHAAIDYPVTEHDLMARHLRLVGSRDSVTASLRADPDWCDPVLAGWWAWGLCAWIGGGWCSGNGPWVLTPEGVARVSGTGRGVSSTIPYLSTSGQGVHGNTDTAAWVSALAARLRRVRVCGGDWQRVVTSSVLHTSASTPQLAGVLLDPPYPAGENADGLYAVEHGAAASVWHDAAAWAVEAGSSPRHRIVLCGYVGMWDPPPGWSARPWKSLAGHRREKGQRQEVLWCSPHCVPPADGDGMFGSGGAS